MLNVSVNRNHTELEANGTPEEISTDATSALIALYKSMKEHASEAVAETIILAVIATTTKVLDLSIDDLLRGIFLCDKK